MTKTRSGSWAVASDYLSVVYTEDGFGAFPTELEAIEKQISFIESEIGPLREALATARRRRNNLRKKAGIHGGGA